MKRILIIDDEQDIGHLMRAMLRSAGYRVEYACCAASARKLLLSHDFQTIFLDLHLGDEHGLNLLPAIKESQENPDIVVITAYDEPAIRKRVAKEGIRHFIPKPFKKSQVLEMLA